MTDLLSDCRSPIQVNKHADILRNSSNTVSSTTVLEILTFKNTSAKQQRCAAALSGALFNKLLKNTQRPLTTGFCFLIKHLHCFFPDAGFVVFFGLFPNRAPHLLSLSWEAPVVSVTPPPPSPFFTTPPPPLSSSFISPSFTEVPDCEPVFKAWTGISNEWISASSEATLINRLLYFCGPPIYPGFCGPLVVVGSWWCWGAAGVAPGSEPPCCLSVLHPHWPANPLVPPFLQLAPHFSEASLFSHWLSGMQQWRTVWVCLTSPSTHTQTHTVRVDACTISLNVILCHTGSQCSDLRSGDVLHFLGVWEFVTLAAAFWMSWSCLERKSLKSCFVLRWYCNCNFFKIKKCKAAWDLPWQQLWCRPGSDVLAS